MKHPLSWGTQPFHPSQKAWKPDLGIETEVYIAMVRRYEARQKAWKPDLGIETYRPRLLGFEEDGQKAWKPDLGIETAMNVGW